MLEGTHKRLRQRTQSEAFVTVAAVSCRCLAHKARIIIKSWASPVFDPKDELVEAVHMFKAGLVCDREHDEEPVPSPHVLFPHSTELLLACCIQNCRDRHMHDQTGHTYNIYTENSITNDPGYS